MYSVAKNFAACKVDKTHGRGKSIVTITKHGMLAFNKVLQNEFELINFKFIQILHNTDQKVLCFLFSKNDKEGFKSLGESKDKFSNINITSALKKCEINYSISKRYLPLINKQENAIFIELNSGEDCSRNYQRVKDVDKTVV